MASPTALASGIAPSAHPALRRTQTSQTATDSEPPSEVVSPFDSPRHSQSSTSLSSMSSVDAKMAKESFGRLIDGYGNDFTPPDFTIKDIHDAIPKHCFKRSALKGYSYILRDVACLATTFYLANTFLEDSSYISSPLLRIPLWTLYTVLQGLFATGLWVIAHECGHGAFSDSTVINDVTGWVLHSSLLVPYFSWKISHGKHHKATGNMERDMVFVPRTREAFANRIGALAHEVSELAEESPIYTLLHLVGQQLIGWPNYLMTNVTGHNYHERQREGRGKGKHNGYKGGVNHFDPSSPLYEAKDAKYIVLSDIGIAISATVLFFLGQKFGWSKLAIYYFVPYLWVNHWLVAITYLQHTDPSLPHYTGDEWNFVRGAAATIDREFGFVGRHLLHGIIETHVLHHYISSIPFYNADEASDAIRPVMGKHYRADVEGGSLGFLASMWKSARRCQWVEPSAEAEGKGKGILFYRNQNGLGTKPMTMKA